MCIPHAYLIHHMLNKCLWNGGVKYPFVVFSGKLLIFSFEIQESYYFGLNLYILHCDHFHNVLWECWQFMRPKPQLPWSIPKGTALTTLLLVGWAWDLFLVLCGIRQRKFYKLGSSLIREKINSTLSHKKAHHSCFSL